MSTQEVWRSYFKGLIYASIALFVAIAIALILNKYYSIGQSSINKLGVVGVFFDAIAIYGFSEMRTWSGITPPEILNQRLLIVCLSLGLIFSALSYLLEPF